VAIPLIAKSLPDIRPIFLLYARVGVFLGGSAAGHEDRLRTFLEPLVYMMVDGLAAVVAVQAQTSKSAPQGSRPSDDTNGLKLSLDKRFQSDIITIT